jgi:integrase
MKITQAVVRRAALPTGKSDVIYFDDDIAGFGLRLRNSGSNTWIFQYKVGVKNRRITIGAVSAVDLGAARDTAKDLYAQVRLGRDPAGEKQRARLTASETVAAAVAPYLEHARRALRPRSFEDVERHLSRYAKPLHGLQLEKVGKRDIALCVAAVRSKSGPFAGNRFRTSLSGFFAWAMGEGLVESNPVSGTTRLEEKSRERVLGLDELRLIWNALPDSDYGRILKLLLLTGARAGEIAGLRRDELRDAAILLPGTRTKNHREHLIPLSAPAGSILAAALKHRGDGSRNLIFGQGAGPFSGWSNCKEALDQRIAAVAGKSLAPWRVHDLRRSFSTHAAAIGIQPHIIEVLLGHVSTGPRSGVAGIYNRHAYEAEQRTALDRWGEYLMAVVEGRRSSVATLKRA